MAEFTERTVLITGAAGGIGTAMAEGFAAAGARLALVDNRDAADLAARLGPDHRSFVCDLTDPADVADVVARIGADMGIDVVINNAGIGFIFKAADVRLAEWDATLNVNLRAPWLVAAAALPWLKRSGHGRVVNIASQAGVIGLEDHAAYGASKAGLIGLTKVMAVEWAEFGITANAISPTVVETPMALIGWPGEKGIRARQEIPVGRFARPDEIAAAALFLASQGAAMITGTNLLVDGGRTSA